MKQAGQLGDLQTQLLKKLHLSQDLRRFTVGHQFTPVQQRQAGAVPGQAQVLAQQDQGEVVFPG